MVIVAGICVVGVLLFLGDRRADIAESDYGNRAAFDTVAGPANNLLSTPAHWVGGIAGWFDDYLFAVSENRRLRKEVAELSQFKNDYLQSKELNRRYETLLQLRTDPQVAMVTARSVSVSRGPFNNARLINAGREDGVKFGHPVINEQGLIGRVVGTSGQVSRVLNVTDVVSRVPVVISRTDARAIMAGDGGGYPRLEFVRGKDAVKKGDQVLTSGDGGVFPRGLPIGEVVASVDGVWRINLYTNRGPIDMVKVLKYDDFSNLPDYTILNTPSVTDVLPPPPAPAPIQTQAVSASASSSGTSSAASSAAAPRAPASRTTTQAPAPRPATPAPTPRPAPTPVPAQAQPAAAPAAVTPSATPADGD
ncbi:MAG: rod shape-determining protein MreC [Asticcacaulis sp.]